MSDTTRRDDRRSDEWNAYDSNEWNVWSLPPAAYPSNAESSAEPSGTAHVNDAEHDGESVYGMDSAADPGYAMFDDGLADIGDTSADERLLAMTPDNELPAAGRTDSGEFPDVPDADAIAANSPVDPASPPDQFHGTDLLNGVGLHPEEETDDSLI